MTAQRVLIDFCELIVDCEHKTAPTTEDGYPSIRTPNIGRGFFILDNANRVSVKTYHQWTKRAVPLPGDLIMAREAPVGNVAVVPLGLQPCLGQRTLLIRPDKTKVDPRYLMFLLLGEEVQGCIHGMTNGATVPHLNMKDVRSLRLPVIPPLPTQHKIAAILSAYDDLIENNLRRIKILEVMARSLYREWLVNFRFPGHQKVRMVNSPLGKIPEGWEATTLGAMSEERRDSVNPSEVDESTPYFGLEHLPRRSIALMEWGSASDVGSSKLRVKKDQILFGKIRPYFHKVGPSPIDAICSSDIIVLAVRKPELYALVLGCVSSDDFVAHATQTSKGTKMPRADWHVLSKYGVVVPTTKLLKKFNEVVEPSLRAINNNVFRTINLRQTRDLLLPKLISGELDVSKLDIKLRERSA